MRGVLFRYCRKTGVFCWGGARRPINGELAETNLKIAVVYLRAIVSL